MTENEKPVEKRLQKRFRAQDDAYAMLRGSVSKLGKILDISRGGLAFRYIDIGERPESSFELEILVKGNGFHLNNVSFETISDFGSTKDFPFSSIPMRRRGGQFLGLTENQISELEYFMEHYTTGEA